MSIPVTTYDDMNKARSAFQEARSEFSKVYYNYLSTILEEAGFRNKLARLKKDGTLGQFKIASDPYTDRPWSIQFYPCRKSDGQISLKTKYVGLYSWHEGELVQQLENIAEVVGDLP